MDVPPWLRWRTGEGPLLLVAPHGGLSERDLLEPPERPTRTNDLFTATLAAELAERLDAGLIANPELDRNELDLNRISAVERRAPWFFELLRSQVEQIVARHGVAEVVFVHGWHIVQPKCDIGIGAWLEHGGAAAHPDRVLRLTVAPAYVAQRLEALRHALAAVGIAAAYGERWPAAHRNNVMQLFRRGAPPRSGAAGRLLAVASAGRVHAVQLELGAPLRWPGTVRQRFGEAFVAAFAGGVVAPQEPPARADGEVARSALGAGDAAGAVRAAPRPSRALQRAAWSAASSRRAAPLARAVSLQAYDLAAGVGVVAGVGPMPDGRLGARFLLFVGGQCLTLFTGEEADAERPSVGPLELRPTERGLALQFSGPALWIPDGARHFRFESAQCDARVVHVAARLELATRPEETYGRVVGEVAIDGETTELSAGGFAGAAIGRPPPAAAASSLRLLAGFGEDVGVAVHAAGGEPGRVVRLGGRRPELAPDAEIAVAPWLASTADGVPEHISLQPHGAEPLSCRVCGRLALLRPLDAARYVRITFGVAEFEWGVLRRGAGFFEHTTIEPGRRSS